MLGRRWKSLQITSRRQIKVLPILLRLPSVFYLYTPEVLYITLLILDVVRGFRDYSTPPRIAPYHYIS